MQIASPTLVLFLRSRMHLHANIIIEVQLIGNNLAASTPNDGLLQEHGRVQCS